MKKEEVQNYLASGKNGVSRIIDGRQFEAKPVCWNSSLFCHFMSWDYVRAQSISEFDVLLKTEIANKEERNKQLEIFLDANGVTLGTRDEDVHDVNRFYVDHVFGCSEIMDVDPEWYNFIGAYSFFLGDLIIDRTASFRKLRWHVRRTSIAKSGAYFKAIPTIKGFNGGVPEPDIIWLILGVGRSVLETHPDKDPTANGRFTHPRKSFVEFLNRYVNHAR